MCSTSAAAGESVEHGTTVNTEDELFASGDDLDGAPHDRFLLAGVPFCFRVNGLLVGIDPLNGDIADRPAMSIDAFRRTSLPTTHLKDRMSEDYFVSGYGI